MGLGLRGREVADEGRDLRPQSILRGNVVYRRVPSGSSSQVELSHAIRDLRARLRGNLPPAQVPYGGIVKAPKRELTPAALYELLERHSQCVFDQSGKCPLLVFTQQMRWEINEFFNGEDNENTVRRRRNPPTGVAHEDLE
jgi:hypothetical protein